VRTFFASLLFLVLALVFCIEIELREPYVLLIVAGVSFFGFILSWLMPSLSFVLLGVCLCMLPIFGSGVLSVFLSCWLLGERFRRIEAVKNEGLLKNVTFAFTILILATAIGALKTLLLEYDPYILLANLSYSGLPALFELRFRWMSPIAQVCHYIVAALLALSVGQKTFREERTGSVLSSLYAGLALGAICSTVYCVLQINNVHPIFSLRQAAFWDYVSRYSGSFSDPNAFGVMAAFIIPLLFFIGEGKGKLLFRLAAIGLLLVVPWSGSRTFWVAMFLWFLAIAGHSVRASKGEKTSALSVGISVFSVFLLVLLGEPGVNKALQQSLPSPGAYRVLETLNWNSMGRMISNRVLFADLAIEEWETSPAIGVGLTRFRDELPQAKVALGINERSRPDVNRWEDNANNYYLHVLAEQGVLGLFFVLLVIVLFGMTLHQDASRQYKMTPFELIRWALVILLITLFTGPHIHFPEVLYLVAILLGLGVRLAQSDRNRLKEQTSVVVLATVLLLVGFLVTIFDVGRPVHAGFYPKETDKSLTYAWTVDRAELALCKDLKPRFALEFRSMEPGINDNPIHIQLRAFSVHGSKADRTVWSSVQSVALTRNRWKRAIIKGIEADTKPPVRIQMRVSRMCNPKKLVLEMTQDGLVFK